MSIKVTSWVWENSPSSKTELLILLAIADQANDDGECFMKLVTIAKKARVHVDTATRHVHDLITKDRVERVERPGRSNVYRVVMHTPPQLAGGTPPQIAPP